MKIRFATRNRYRPRKRRGISRNQLLEALLPGLNALFNLEYAKYEKEHQALFEEAENT